MVAKKRKPHRKALIISVLDYPHVHHKHGGSTSGCFTDALLTARMLQKYYGFNKIEEEEDCRGVKRAFHARSKSIRVCCTYSWGESESGGNTQASEEPSSSASTSGSGNLDLVDSDCDIDHFSDTHHDVVKCIEWLVRDARKGDTLVLCFTGCSTYKCIEVQPGEATAEVSGASSSQPTSTSTKLEPVLCLGDFSWENMEAGYLNCEALQKLLLSKVDRAACELTLILDTYLGSSMTEMLQKEVSKNRTTTTTTTTTGQHVSKSLPSPSRSVSGRYTHPDAPYHSMPWNRVRCLKLPQNERKILRRIQSYKRRSALRRVWSLAIDLGRLKKYFKRLVTRKGNRVSPLSMEGGKEGGGERDRDSRSLLSPASTPPCKKLDSLQTTKYVFFAVESCRMGGVVYKNNVIDFVKLGPLTWVFYNILKGRLRDKPAKVMDMLHPNLSTFLESANHYFQYRWRSGIGRTKSYRCVMKTSLDVGTDVGTYKLFSNVHSEDTLKSYDEILVDRKLKDARAFSLTHDLAQMIMESSSSPDSRNKTDLFGQRNHLDNNENKLQIANSPNKLEPLEKRGASSTNGASPSTPTTMQNLQRKPPPTSHGKKLPPLST